MYAFKHLRLDELQELSKGDDAFINRMLESYCTQVPQLLEKLRDGIKTNDKESVRATAHRLRPSFHYLGRTDLSLLLEEIELGSATIPNNSLTEKSELIFEEASLMLREAQEALQQTKS
jgi:HPt (histidine-containing phosphotransfer) domain-containing protein